MPDMGDPAHDDFLSEAQELVEKFGRDLIALDELRQLGREDPELVASLFRSVHTIKGNAYTMGAKPTGDFSHDLERLLDALRLQKVPLSSTVLSVLYESTEMYPKLLQAERDGFAPPAEEIAVVVDSIHQLLPREKPPEEEPPPPEEEPPSLFRDYQLDPGLLAVLTEYEEHRLHVCIDEGLSLYWLKGVFYLMSVGQDLDEVKALVKPLGEIITTLPSETDAEADLIGLNILMASSLSAEELQEVLNEKGVTVERIPKHAPRMLTEAPPGPPPMPSRVPESLPEVDLLLRPESMLTVPPAQSTPAPRPSPETLQSVAQTVRVDIEKLNRLMNIVGELAIVRTQLARIVERLRETPSERAVTTDLHRVQRTFERHLDSMQNGILEVRMVPLEQVFQRLAVVVRRTALDLGRTVNLVITGAETEVDKLIVEALIDPLMHIVRNAIDHGLEPEAERQAVGKPAAGTIALNAFQQGSHVVVEVEDDGKGVNTEKLIERAIERRIITREEAQMLSLREVLNLVFLPGLTTKDVKTQIAGAGVGMDVVKTNIAKLGGIIDISSEAGIGTKLSITLPITLAIMSALMVRCAGRLFAIPLANVQEAVVLDRTAIREIDGRNMITLRGNTLPLCSLTRLFELPPEEEASQAPSENAHSQALPVDTATPLGLRWGTTPKSNKQFIVVTNVGSRRLGIVVESLVGEQDIVIKALGPSLKSVRGFAGATELGDQRIALVIDVQSLVEETLSTIELGRLEHAGGFA